MQKQFIEKRFRTSKILNTLAQYDWYNDYKFYVVLMDIKYTIFAESFSLCIICICISLFYTENIDIY